MTALIPRNYNRLQNLWSWETQISPVGVNRWNTYLNQNLPYTSGAEWLGTEILKDRQVIAVAGTHGKTTTTAMIAWILSETGLDPGFLIGGVPVNIDWSAKLGSGRHFVVEADEYDTSLFRSTV